MNLTWLIYIDYDIQYNFKIYILFKYIWNINKITPYFFATEKVSTKQSQNKSKDLNNTEYVLWLPRY